MPSCNKCSSSSNRSSNSSSNAASLLPLTSPTGVCLWGGGVSFLSVYPGTAVTKHLRLLLLLMHHAVAMLSASWSQ